MDDGELMIDELMGERIVGGFGQDIWIVGGWIGDGWGPGGCASG